MFVDEMKKKLLTKASTFRLREKFTSLWLAGRIVAYANISHEKYCPKFCFKSAHKYGIELPIIAQENCMFIELEPEAFENVSVVVVYPKEF